MRKRKAEVVPVSLYYKICKDIFQSGFFFAKMMQLLRYNEKFFISKLCILWIFYSKRYLYDPGPFRLLTLGDVFIQTLLIFTHHSTMNLEVDGCPSKENLFRQSTKVIYKFMEWSQHLKLTFITMSLDWIS